MSRLILQDEKKDYPWMVDILFRDVMKCRPHGRIIVRSSYFILDFQKKHSQITFIKTACELIFHKWTNAYAGCAITDETSKTRQLSFAVFSMLNSPACSFKISASASQSQLASHKESRETLLQTCKHHQKQPRWSISPRGAILRTGRSNPREGAGLMWRIGPTL